MITRPGNQKKSVATPMSTSERFSSFKSVYIGAGTHIASYLKGSGGSFLGVKRPERAADHFPPYSTYFKV
jgi:hypothetical protein